MAASGVPVSVGPGWEDLYSLTGFAVGTPLLIANVGPTNAFLALADSEPTDEIGSYVEVGEQYQVDGSAVGLWCQTRGQATTLYVQDARGAVRELSFSDPRVVDGNKSFTVQPYTELNIKNGVQFYARASWPEDDPIASGDANARNIYFQIGNSTVLTKLRIFDYIGEEIKFEILSEPTVTGGDSVAVSNWNLKNPSPTVVTVKKDVTITDDGTIVGDPEYFYGGSSSGQRVQSSIPEGYERVVPPNSNFAIRITNTSNTDARAQYFLTWYEGEISTEIP